MPIALTMLAAAALASASPDDAAVIHSVNELLDSWRTADNARGEAVLHADFRLTTLQGEPGDRKVYTVDRAGLLSASKDLKPNDWDDRLSNVTVRIGNNGLAVVTADYMFNQNDKPTHCGLVSFQLYRVEGEWKILSFADTHNNLKGQPPAEVCQPSQSTKGR
jgi:hypothetical protein